MRVLCLLLLLGPACAAQADVFRPAYLEIRETVNDRYEVMWKVPMLAEARLAVDLRFPEGTKSITERQGQVGDGALVERWTIQRAGGLAGQTMAIDGIAGGVTDVIVRIERVDGTSQVEHVLPQRPEFVIQGTTDNWQVAASYLVLGIKHIVGGIDHLLFVLALLLIVRGARRIILTITAFTIAHSITLVSATLGWVTVPGAPVEAIIALSIVFVAAEAIRGLQGRPGLTARAPWVVAFSFGLLHGFGFAGALAEVGLPQNAIPVALLVFNVGVEIGQLLFVIFLLGVRALLDRCPLAWPQWALRVPPYVIGTVAMVWVMERVGTFWA